MPKKLSEYQKNQISNSFIEGLEIKKISEIYNFSSQTIVKQLKSILGEEEYKSVKSRNIKKSKKKLNVNLNKEIKDKNEFHLKDKSPKVIDDNKSNVQGIKDTNAFFEIAPLTEGVDLESQKDLTSIPINSFELPIKT